MMDKQGRGSPRPAGRIVVKIALTLFILAFGAVGLAFMKFGHSFCSSSSNAVIYFVRDEQGWISATTDLSLEEAEKLVFSLDMNCLFSWLFHREAIASKKTIFDVTWDEMTGRGNIKQFRPDGTMFAVTFSRFRVDGKEAQGLFIGGELPLGDYDRSKDGETSGMSYFDGVRWNHIWCAANEGLAFQNRRAYLPTDWKYLSGRLLKGTNDEVILESTHALQAEGKHILMHRLASMKAGDDHLDLVVELKNRGGAPVEFNYSYGDEPWVGKFSSSQGDVGWTESGLVRYEAVVSLSKNRYAGYWDYGNDAAGEGHVFSGNANFIHWVSPMPTTVYFSNDFSECCAPDRPLASSTSRVMNIVWAKQVIFPGESRNYKMVIGRAGINKDTGFPEFKIHAD